MKLVVTGASGFLGTRLTERLSHLGHEVTAIARSPVPAALASKANVHWLSRDILRDGLEPALLASAEAIFHLAAAKEVAPGRDERMLIETNELLTARLLQALAGGNQRLVFASTQMVYGDPGHTAVTEEFPLLGMDSTPYACSKLNTENWLRCLLKQRDIKCVVLRFCGFVEGGGNIDYIIDRALRHEPILLLSEGKVGRDYLDLDTGIAAFVAALSYRGAAPFAVFNIGSGQKVAAAELAQMVCAELGSRSEIVLSKQPAPRADFVFDITKARNELGFEPGNLPEAIRGYARRKRASFNGAEAHG